MPTMTYTFRLARHQVDIWRGPVRRRYGALQPTRTSRCLGYRGYATVVKKPIFDESYDVVVVGSGAAGLTAAVTAAKKAGLKVLVTEKTNYFGGTTCYSSGALYIPGNKHQKSLGVGEDSIEKATTYLKANLGDLYQEDRIQAFLKSGPELIDWLENETAVRFYGAPQPDYQYGLPGSMFGRVIIADKFDGRRLGDMVKSIRYPLMGMSAFGNMQVDLSDYNTWKHPFSSAKNFRMVTKGLIRYAMDLLRYRKGTYLCNGNALVGSLVHTNLENGTTFWNNSPVTKVIADRGRAIGVVIEKDGRPVRVEAKKGIVLASGGFARSKELMSKYSPLAQHTAGPRGNVGDGLRLGQEAGARLPPPLSDNVLYSPVSEFHPKNGPMRRYPHSGFDRTKPGYIFVDTDGKRFVNEAEPYQTMGVKMKEASISKAWLVGDHKAVRTYGMGVALPRPYPKWPVERSGYWVKAKTIEKLASKMGVPVENMVRTVERFNENARQGKDPDFHRGEHEFDRSYGDPGMTPNPNLRPLEKGPYYAVATYPGCLCSLYGLDVNKDSQVLDANGKAIPGLYAAGADQNSVMMGKYPGGGSCLGPATVFGYRAALHLANQ